MKQLSIIVPCLNESEYIASVFEWIRKECAHIDYEVLVVDGGSRDNTLAIVEEFTSRYPEFRLISNPDQYVSHALNCGIAVASGAYIARLDAHAQYPEGYFEKCLQLMKQSNADNIGGYVLYKGLSPASNGFAAALCSSWGIGYRTLDTIRFDHYTDTVSFGFWKREIFDRYGLFDLELVRDQDEEFNYRMVKKGGRIFKSASIITEVYVRKTLGSLFKQFFEYGYYKPLVIKKIGHIVRIRHLIPSAFVIYLLLLLISPQFYSFILIYLYLLVTAYFSFNQSNSFVSKIYCFIAFPVVHIAYGSGFLAGIIRSLK